MRIEEELKLDYSDVLFRPKRSTLTSRKEVDLNRTYKFKYSKNEWSGVPIMASNMDGVGELGVAEKLSEFNMITCLTKQHDVKKLNQYKIKNIIKVAIDVPVDDLFDYFCQDQVSIGQYVVVPFGNRKVVGVVSLCCYNCFG